jgi:hypothetical protein
MRRNNGKTTFSTKLTDQNKNFWKNDFWSQTGHGHMFQTTEAIHFTWPCEGFTLQGIFLNCFGLIALSEQTQQKE